MDNVLINMKILLIILRNIKKYPNLSFVELLVRLGVLVLRVEKLPLGYEKSWYLHEKKIDNLKD